MLNYNFKIYLTKLVMLGGLELKYQRPTRARPPEPVQFKPGYAFNLKPGAEFQFRAGTGTRPGSKSRAGRKARSNKLNTRYYPGPNLSHAYFSYLYWA